MADKFCLGDVVEWKNRQGKIDQVFRNDAAWKISFMDNVKPASEICTNAAKLRLLQPGESAETEPRFKPERSIMRRPIQGKQQRS